MVAASAVAKTGGVGDDYADQKTKILEGRGWRGRRIVPGVSLRGEGRRAAGGEFLRRQLREIHAQGHRPALRQGNRDRPHARHRTGQRLARQPARRRYRAPALRRADDQRELGQRRTRRRPLRADPCRQGAQHEGLLAGRPLCQRRRGHWHAGAHWALLPHRPCQDSAHLLEGPVGQPGVQGQNGHVHHHQFGPATCSP